jgi:lysophospholipase L1-like esterase
VDLESRLAALIRAIIVVTLSVTIALALAEGVLRLKNASMKNYDVEMWRYAKELKQPAENIRLGHEHIPNRSAILQSVEIRTNEYGLRGPGPVPPRAPDERRVLFLGGSITLGWGVEESKTMTAVLERRLAEAGQKIDVLNAGVGNYNAERYVGNFFDRLTPLNATDIVVHYFLRDAEDLGAGGGNILLRNSELALTLWIAGNRVFGSAQEGTLIEHYKHVYNQNSDGYQEMHGALARLADYARQNNIRLYLAMVPDVHDLKNYRFGFVHEKMAAVAKELGYTYVDLLPAFGALSPEEVWAMPGDPHPNALGHEMMAKAMLPVLLHTQ